MIDGIFKADAFLSGAGHIIFVLDAGRLDFGIPLQLWRAGWKGLEDARLLAKGTVLEWKHGQSTVLAAICRSQNDVDFADMPALLATALANVQLGPDEALAFALDPRVLPENDRLEVMIRLAAARKPVHVYVFRYGDMSGQP